MRQRIFDALNESADNPVFWSTSEMDSLIEEAQEAICEELEAIKRTVFIPLRDGQLYFFLRGFASDVMSPYRLYTTHNARRLTATTVGQLDARNERWSRVTGDPQVWAPVGWDSFVVYPHIATGGGTLRMDYLAWPRPLMDDSDEPESDTDEGILLYAIHDGLLKQWDAQHAVEAYQLFLQRFTIDKGQNTRITQARTWQAAAQPGSAFRNGGSQWEQ